MAERTLRLRVLTPQGSAFDEWSTSIRAPTDTGQVGLRPRSEAAALAIEPGLVLAETPERVHFVATAGGLLRCDGREAVLLTPLAVVGEDEEAVRRALANALGDPRADLELRGVLQRLETGILKELRRGIAGGRGGGQVG